MDKSILKSWAPYIFIVLLTSVFVLAPSFNLSLTGDDFLGLYRYDEAIRSGVHPLRYWFTDYGPQDTVTFLIHSYFGFTPQVYYFFSFLTRLFAALSFIPLLIYFTKDRRAAFITALFFAVGTTGLETTDWSFNMPSYIAIGILNFFLISYSKLRKQFSYPKLLTALFLFLLAITMQPIRLAFLPLALFASELIVLLVYRKNIVQTLIRVAIFIISFIVLLKGTGIGTTASGVTGSTGASSTVEIYLAGVSQAFEKKDMGVLLTPISQLGGVILPDTFISPHFNSYSDLKAGLLIVLPLFLFSLLLFLLIRYFYPKTKMLFMYGLCALSLFWTIYTFYTFRIAATYPVQIRELILTLLGGYFLLAMVLVLVSFYTYRKTFYITLLSISIIGISYGIAWVRSPGLMNTTVGRYLIVSLAGLAILLGVLYAKTVHKRLFAVLILIPLFLIHGKMSQEYLSHLSSRRSILPTEKIRNSFVLDAKADEEMKPSVYYFQTDNQEMLHHTTIFGFPMFMHYYAGAKHPWNIAYTTSWKEVYDAHVTGESLQRFGSISPIEPVALTHIYGYKIESGELRDITSEVREKLQKETQLPKQ